MTSLAPGVRVHVVGVGGAGMSGLARLLVEMGCGVSGSDVVESPVLVSLRDAGVVVTVGHDASNGSDAQIIVFSPAIPESNVELVAARNRGASLLTRAQVLATLAQRQPVIGLTGTHGKTTATSMLAHVLHAAGRDDSRLLGAAVTGLGENGHLGTGSLVLEVDESFGTFSLLVPFALGLLNVESDHLDHYGTVEALEAEFAHLLARTTGPVVVWGDDPGAARVASRSGRDVQLVGTRDAAWTVENVTLDKRSASFRLTGPIGALELCLGVTGAHNVANAAVVAALASALGVAPDAIATGLRAFCGAPRRFEYLGQWRGVDVYEDYAHLPGEIAATLAAARSIGYERVTAVFQPHRVTRTLSLAEPLAAALEGADNIVVADIYASGEANPTGATGELVARHIHARPGATSAYGATFDDVLKVLESRHDQSDVVLLLGAGDIAQVAQRLSGGLS
ncbi:MAG: UDP-N-acetylmuramate--L-alanine ligase [Acidimicrobiales bacterium]